MGKKWNKKNKNKKKNRKKNNRKVHTKHKRDRPEWMDVQNDQPIPVQFFGSKVASSAGCTLQAPQLEGHALQGNGYVLHKGIPFSVDDKLWRLSLEIRTEESKSMIFAMRPEDPMKHEHILVTLEKGRIVMMIIDKNGKIHKLRQSSSSARVSDNSWHKIDIVRQHGQLQLLVNGVVEANGKAVVYNSFPNAVSNKPAGIDHLMYAGSVPSNVRVSLSEFLPEKDIVGYKGCLRGHLVNGARQRIEDAADTVLVEPCFNGEREIGVGFFAGGYIYHRPSIQQHGLYPLSGRHIEIITTLRARTQDGVIFAVRGRYTKDALALVLNGGKIEAWMWQKGKEYTVSFEPKTRDSVLCNGRWHTISVLKTRNLLVLTVGNNDPVYVEGQIDVDNFQTTTPLYIGGLPKEEVKNFEWPMTKEFVGCIGNVMINRSKLDNRRISVTGDVTLDYCPAN